VKKNGLFLLQLALGGEGGEEKYVLPRGFPAEKGEKKGNAKGGKKARGRFTVIPPGREGGEKKKNWPPRLGLLRWKKRGGQTREKKRRLPALFNEKGEKKKNAPETEDKKKRDLFSFSARVWIRKKGGEKSPGAFFVIRGEKGKGEG